MRAISTRKVSFQCLYDVIPVLDTGFHPRRQCPDTGIQFSMQSHQRHLF
ncbi:hypothetical protein [Wolbachia endosymbiont of Psylliodes chrysocephala]|nr:hypothetical protein [Wolbachia endosymbiont of Psylliodes chrysocephala]